MKSTDGRELIRLFTANGEAIVCIDDLNRSSLKILKVYDRKGERITSDTTSSRQRNRGLGFGVHRNNLFPTRREARENRERIFADIFNRPQTAAVEA